MRCEYNRFGLVRDAMGVSCDPCNYQEQLNGYLVDVQQLAIVCVENVQRVLNGRIRKVHVEHISDVLFHYTFEHPQHAV